VIAKAEWGDTALGPWRALGADGKGDDAPHTEGGVGDVEAVNLLESEGLVSAEQAEVGRRAYCLEAMLL
jgi:hypothetical protein